MTTHPTPEQSQTHIDGLLEATKLLADFADDAPSLDYNEDRVLSWIAVVVSKARLAISKAQAQSTPSQTHIDGWQPIETAPRGWTDILLYVPDEDDGTGSQGVVKGWYSEADGGFDCWLSYESNESNDGQVFPTHWQPLPKPPSGSHPYLNNSRGE